jgi:hypothetical protein
MQTYHNDINADFICKNCGCFVTSHSQISGVVNRNHCPNCLHSRHVDLYDPGDRLCACKALMKPVGLTLKRSKDKYAPEKQGELMLVHRCTYCGELSINRIAADDDPDLLFEILREVPEDYSGLFRACRLNGIRLLEEERHRPLVQHRLFGNAFNLTVVAAVS